MTTHGCRPSGTAKGKKKGGGMGGIKERKNTVMEYQEKRKVLNRNMRISKE